MFVTLPINLYFGRFRNIVALYYKNRNITSSRFSKIISNAINEKVVTGFDLDLVDVFTLVK